MLVLLEVPVRNSFIKGAILFLHQYDCQHTFVPTSFTSYKRQEGNSQPFFHACCWIHDGTISKQPCSNHLCSKSVDLIWNAS